MIVKPAMYNMSLEKWRRRWHRPWEEMDYLFNRVVEKQNKNSDLQCQIPQLLIVAGRFNGEEGRSGDGKWYRTNMNE